MTGGFVSSSGASCRRAGVPVCGPPAGWQAVGGASVGGFQPDFIGVCGRDGRAGGVLSVGADRRLCRDCDAGASDTSDAREAIMLLAPGSVSEMQDYIPENRCYRATLEFQVTV